jgi:DNA-binding CsgD family transcriptional regulator
MNLNPALIPGSGASEFFKSQDKYYCVSSGIIEEVIPQSESFRLADTLLINHAEKEKIHRLEKDPVKRVFLFIDKYMSCFNYTPDAVSGQLTDQDGTYHFHIGEATISPREQEIIREISSGKADKEIALKLFISKHTVSTTIRNIREKLNAHSKFHIISKAAHAGII